MSPAGAQKPRRGFLKAITGTCAALGSLLTVVPGLRFLVSPLLRKSPADREGELPTAARLEEIASGAPLRVDLFGSLQDGWERRERAKIGTAWLVRDGQEKVRAFSTVCPHLGCGVDWNPQTAQFDCPCHQSHFDGAGHCVSGPSPRDLDELEVVTVGDEVKVRYQRFQLSTPTKESLG